MTSRLGDSRAQPSRCRAIWLAAMLLWVPPLPRMQPGSFTFLNPTTRASGMGSLGGSQNDLHFINSQTGVVIGYDGAYRSDDGGLTWRKLPLPDIVSDDGKATGRNWYAVRMTSARSVWALGQIHPGGLNRSRLLHSEDGGETWAEALHGRISGAVHLEVTGPGEVWAMCHDRAFVTRDDGASWEPVALGIPGYVGLRDVWALSPELYYAVGDVGGYAAGGFAACSTDGGRTWRRLAADAALPSLWFCQFVSPAEGWAAGRGLWHTADAGATWSEVVLPLNAGQRLTGLRLFADGRGWVSAGIRWEGGAPLDSNAVLYTYDWGLHWVPVAGGWKCVNAMYWLDSERGWVCGVVPGFVPAAFVGLYNWR